MRIAYNGVGFSPGLYVNAEAVARFRELLSMPAEEPWAEAERALEAARLDGKVLRVEYRSPSAFPRGTNEPHHIYTIYTPTDIPHIYDGDTRAEAARAAVEHVRGLEAKNALPNEESMSTLDMAMEMIGMGYRIVINGRFPRVDRHRR